MARLQPEVHSIIRLASLVGAFAAGLVMADVHFEDHRKRGERPLHESLHALTGLLVPVFFVRMGCSSTSGAS